MGKGDAAAQGSEPSQTRFQQASGVNGKLRHGKAQAGRGRAGLGTHDLASHNLSLALEIDHPPLADAKVGREFVTIV